jgi:hypothetical protein
VRPPVGERVARWLSLANVALLAFSVWALWVLASTPEGLRWWASVLFLAGPLLAIASLPVTFLWMRRWLFPNVCIAAGYVWVWSHFIR